MVSPTWSEEAQIAATPDETGEFYNRLMAFDFVAQRLEIGDVVLIRRPDEEGEVEATVVREIERTETAVRATLRVKGREDFVKEWPLGELVTVVRGP
ncbi:MAG: hypothetical protein AUG43_00570 [Actinobacteria bacterium 13_1_20CM_3_68_10]|nr:MAG: hypothetical protein AUG43_00570 [Actinobacteria bacterium 13_1_20CM_3_68_10]